MSYVIGHSYPNPQASASQSIQMAAALAKITESTEFYVHDLKQPEQDIRSQFPGVLDSPLRIRNLRMTHQPYRLLTNTRAAFLSYNSRIALSTLGRHMNGIARKQQNVLFVRSRLEFMYWGLLRPYLPWLRKWLFIYEAHDVAGLSPNAALEQNPFKSLSGPEGKRRQRTLKALRRYDLVLCVTQALADDLYRWSGGTVQPYVVRHASGLDRTKHTPSNIPLPSTITLGYVGTIDQERGVHTLIEAMPYLPDRFRLRLVGRIRGRTVDGRGPAWLDTLLSKPDVKAKVNLVPPVPSVQVAEEIDRCNILLLPASQNIISLRYRAPLKLIDYMVRGKPIVAADVPCHREVLQDGVNARLYPYDDVRQLAKCIISLVDQPRQAEAIARAAWEQSKNYTYDERARCILKLVNSVRERQHVGRSLEHKLTS